MTTYSPTTAADLLRAEKDHGITLADELQSAIAGALEQFIGAPDLAYFAMADDLLPALLEEFPNVDLNNYVTEEETAPEVAPSETAKSFDSGSITTAYLARNSQDTSHTYGTWSETDLPVGDHIRLIIPTKDARQMFADGALLVRLNEECVRAQSAEFRKQREKKQAEEREQIRRAISREVQEELFAEELATIDAQAAVIYAQIDQLVDERLGADK